MRRASSHRRAAWAGAAFALGLAGCARPPLGPTALVANTAPDPTIETRDVKLANGFITLQIRLRVGLSGPRPVVVSPVTDDAWLLDEGAMLVTYTVHWEQLRGFLKDKPPPPPGKTYGKWLLASVDPGKVGAGYFGFIDYAAREAVPKVLDYVLTQPEADPNRVAIAGHSTVGFTALQAIAIEPRVRAATVLNACGDYHTFLRDSNLGLDGKDPLALQPEYDAWLSAREPIQHPERLTHTALLMINGTADPTVPYSCAETTYAAFARAYRHHGGRRRFKTVTLQAATHEISTAARDAMRAWWRRWLLDRRAKSASSARSTAPRT